MNVYRACTGKLRFGSRPAARKFIAARHQNAERRVYACPLCEGYHITSKPSRSDDRAEANRLTVEQVRPLLALGLGVNEMAEQVGVTPGQVHRAINKIRAAESK